MEYNREFKNIDNKDKAYILGLFYADGNISNYHSALSLNKKDREVLDKIHLKFPFFNKYEISARNQILLNSGIQKLYKDFKNNGLIERKSFENKDKLILPKLDKSLYSHFIRGYFDGDGGCTLSLNTKKVQKRVYIYSVNLNLLNSFIEILKLNNIKTTLTLSNPDTMVYKVTISTESYTLFYNYIYNDCDLFIKRKKEVFNDIFKTNLFVQACTPNCPACNSNYTVKNGSYKYKNKIKQKFLCKNCLNIYYAD